MKDRNSAGARPEKESFRADPSISKDLYLQTRKRYPSFKAGLLLAAIAIAGIAYDIYNQYLWAEFGCGWENIAIHVAVGIAFILLLVGAVFLSLSGGKAELINKDREALSLYGDHLVITYRFAKGKYRLGRKVVYFCDISGMEYDDDRKCLKIYADCRSQLSRGKAFDGDGVVTEEKEHGMTCIYAKYQEFEQIVKGVEARSRKKASSTSALY